MQQKQQQQQRKKDFKTRLPDGLSAKSVQQRRHFQCVEVNRKRYFQQNMFNSSEVTHLGPVSSYSENLLDFFYSIRIFLNINVLIIQKGLFRRMAKF